MNQADKNIFIVVQYYNDYNQHGSYFVSAHTTKLGAINSVPHIGRVNYEDSWYEITSEVLGD